jgi:hypothetical protein
MKLTYKNILVVNIMVVTFTGCQFKLQVSAELLSSVLWLCLAYCMHFIGINK